MTSWDRVTRLVLANGRVGGRDTVGGFSGSQQCPITGLVQYQVQMIVPQLWELELHIFEGQYKKIISRFWGDGIFCCDETALHVHCWETCLVGSDFRQCNRTSANSICFGKFGWAFANVETLENLGVFHQAWVLLFQKYWAPGKHSKIWHFCSDLESSHFVIIKY